MKKIFVAGHRGMVGSAICRQLKTQSNVEIIIRTREKLNLCDQQAVHEFMNQKNLMKLYQQLQRWGASTLIIPTLQSSFIRTFNPNNVIHAAHLNDVQKLLFLGSSCIYPRAVEQPMREDALLTEYSSPLMNPMRSQIAGIKCAKVTIVSMVETIGL